ncbi:methionine--tRNA ligase [Paracrocinitomix mangrovi]|uniref:methionine--tRNA ligase n=1 Tax=Paracrocinitomix mangrovi TaxID=2862509 RepID=UPI001C8E4706|nr:methionine--tRNA ligase [Paracrocinitomix mangrovi]UKN00606.1 methionine--tRNA ligase [Paracrocinitomix mangrovi]
MSENKYTITAALPYANGPLHLGHVAGVYLPADIFVRYLRMTEQDVVFVCGSDEHGAAITLRAKKEGTTPKAIVDKYHQINSTAFNDFDISFDIYSRTSNEIHHKTASDYFKKLNDKGSFIEQTTEQYYDEEFKQFLADRYITGTCPNCQNENAYGDQCEKCGSTLSPTELINPVSTLSGKTPVLKQTSHWFLPLDKHEDWLRSWIKDGVLDGKQHHNPKDWRNQVVGQCMSWIDGGLKPRAMTRDLDWGVPVPVEGAEGKVLYVWLDAPIGYISATKEWAQQNGKNWEDYWTGDRKLVHFIGKDNIVFHAIIFPVLLKEHGDFVLPDNVPAYEFLNLEGDKFSTSRNWAVWLHEYIAENPTKIDELKYVLTAIAPESKDSEFTWKEFQARINNELADILGNFVNRAVVLTHKYFEGKVPALGNTTDTDKEVIAEMEKFPAKIGELIMKYKLREAQAEAINLARLGNKYLADTEPWKLAKTDMERVKTIMNVALQITANLSIVFAPFLPKKAQKIGEFVNFDSKNWGFAGKSDLLPEGHQLNKASILIEKIDDAFVDLQVEKLKESSAMNNSNFPPQKEEVAFDDFMKMDIRVGEIIAAERVPKADKLLKLTVDTGLDKRTVVSGIAEHYQPEDIVGTKVSILMNLAPRKIRGVESQGMILMAENENGELSFISPEKAFNAGGEIR